VVDINKCILLEDPAGGKDVQALLNEAVSELAYGRVEQTQQQPQQQQQRKWVADSNMSLHVGPKPQDTPPSLVSYASFVHDTYPDVPGINLKQIKATRDGLKGTFTLPCQPGSRFASEVTNLARALQLPPGLSPSLMKAAGLEGRQRVGLLPAFFHFLRRLQKEQRTQEQQMEEKENNSSLSSAPPAVGLKSQKKKSSSWRFAVQFRTFGEDLPRVIQEYNAFVRGQHPLFPRQGLGMKREGEGGREDEVDYSLDLVGDPECFGCMFRDANGPPALILGTFHPPSSRADLQLLLQAQNKKQQQQEHQEEEQQQQQQEQPHRILEGIPAIYAFMQQRQTSRRPALAIRDYWPWWRQNLEASEAGKLVPLPPKEGGRKDGRKDETLFLKGGGEGEREDEDKGEEEWFTVVMDDNIEHSRAHIIDLRCGKTGEVVPFEEGREGGHLVRAEPYLAIRDPENYFWECLQASLSSRSRRRKEGGRKGQGEDGGPSPVGG